MTFRELFEELKVNQKLIQRLFDVQLIGNRIINIGFMELGGLKMPREG